MDNSPIFILFMLRGDSGLEWRIPIKDSYV